MWREGFRRKRRERKTSCSLASFILYRGAVKEIPAIVPLGLFCSASVVAQLLSHVWRVCRASLVSNLSEGG